MLVGYLGHFDVLLARLLFRRTPIVLDHLVFAADTARDRGVPGCWKVRLLGRLDRRALPAADVVLVDTDEHAALVPADLADRAVVVPVGAPHAWFAAGRAGRPRPADRDGRCGSSSSGSSPRCRARPRSARALGRSPATTGSGSRWSAPARTGPRPRRLAAANPRVEWLDWVPAAELPALVAAHDVCLGIFGTGPKARRVVPNKVYQGAAAGCAVVTSDTRRSGRRSDGAAGSCPPATPRAGRRAARAGRRPGRAGEAAGRGPGPGRERFAPGRSSAPLRDRLRSCRAGAGPMTRRPAPAPPLMPRAWLRWDVVERLLDGLRPPTVLEIGCGQGAMGARLARRAEYLGVEPDPTSCAVARTRVTAAGGTVVHGDHTGGAGRHDVRPGLRVRGARAPQDDAAALADWRGSSGPAAI